MSADTDHRAMEILRWIATGDTGVSSMTLALASVGLKSAGPVGSGAPWDEGDSGRCERLAKQCPFVIEALDVLATKSWQWATWAPRIRAAAGVGGRDPQ